MIIGGGSTGSSILFHLARRGVKDAILLEKVSQIASGQTSRSTALLRSHYSVPTVARMAWDSYQFFQRFEDEVAGGHSGFCESGLLVCSDEKSREGLLENSQMLRGLGIPSRVVDKDELATIEPALDFSLFSLIVYEPESGYAEPSMTASSFAKRAQELGAKVMTNANVIRIRKGSGGRFVVSTEDGREFRARKVVVATGPWSKRFFAEIGVDVPVRAVRHSVAVFRRPDEYSGIRPIIFDFPREAYYKPDGQHLLLAGSLSTEGDNIEVDPDNYNESVGFDEVSKYSEQAASAIPSMGNGQFVRGYTGIYDLTPDQQPIIDEFSSAGFEGLYCLVGLSGHGFKLSPAFGAIMADMLLGEKMTSYDSSIFRKSRFEEGKLLKSRYSLATIC